MKRTSKILLFVMTLLIFSHAFVQPSVAADNTDDFTREDAVALFEKALECFDILQFTEPYYIDTGVNTGYFDYSVYGNGKLFDGRDYFMVNKNYQYGTLEKNRLWAESIFVRDLADNYVNNVIYPNKVIENKNFLYDENGNLLKCIPGHQNGLTTKYNVLGFRSDGNRAVLTVESRRPFSYPEELVANTVKFEKTADGWRVAESGYFNYYLGIAQPDGSPETGDGTVARAAVFAAGAVLAAAVPALILTAKRRRKEN